MHNVRRLPVKDSHFKAVRISTAFHVLRKAFENRLAVEDCGKELKTENTIIIKIRTIILCTRVRFNACGIPPMHPFDLLLHFPLDPEQDVPLWTPDPV